MDLLRLFSDIFLKPETTSCISWFDGHDFYLKKKKKVLIPPALVKPQLRKTAVWRITALRGWLGLSAWNASRLAQYRVLLTGKVTPRSPKVYESYAWSGLIDFYFYQGSLHITESFTKSFIFIFKTFWAIVNTTNKQQVIFPWESKMPIFFPILCCISYGTTPQEQDFLYWKNSFLAHFSFERNILNSIQFWD